MIGGCGEGWIWGLAEGWLGSGWGLAGGPGSRAWMDPLARPGSQILVQGRTAPGPMPGQDRLPGKFRVEPRIDLTHARTHARNANTNTKHDFPVGAACAFPPTSDNISYAFYALDA